MGEDVLTCCSTCDMPREYLEGRSIPFVCFHFTIDGMEYPDDLGESMRIDEFYARIAAGSMPTTSQVNEAEFREFFEPFLAEGKDIVHLSLSSGLSGAYNSAELAKGELLAKYPERNIYVIDTLGGSSGYGLLLDTAADMRDAGVGAKELSEALTEERLNVHHWFCSSDLSHFRRGGRISATSAAIGTLLGICPVMNVSHEGKLVPRKKVRGMKRAIAELASMMEKHAKGLTDYAGKCFLSHSACLDDARSLARLIESKFPRLNGGVMINNIGTVIGSHTGPGTLALYFFGDKRVN